MEAHCNIYLNILRFHIFRNIAGTPIQRESYSEQVEVDYLALRQADRIKPGTFMKVLS